MYFVFSLPPPVWFVYCYLHLLNLSKGLWVRSLCGGRCLILHCMLASQCKMGGGGGGDSIEESSLSSVQQGNSSFHILSHAVAFYHFKKNYFPFLSIFFQFLLILPCLCSPSCICSLNLVSVALDCWWRFVCLLLRLDFFGSFFCNTGVLEIHWLHVIILRIMAVSLLVATILILFCCKLFCNHFSYLMSHLFNLFSH